jgi:hypothetical protein
VPLSNAEYEEILYIGRIAEHHLLIFKSLASQEHALSNPSPARGRTPVVPRPASS